MLIYSDKLTRADLDTIARLMPVELFDTDPEFSGARRRRIKISLRPQHGEAGEKWRKHSVDQWTGRDRRIFAVSWSGHYVFYAALLALDPDAEIKSVLAHWRGADDYYARVDETGSANWGSQMMPQYAAEMQSPDAPTWTPELRRIGEEIASRIREDQRAA